MASKKVKLDGSEDVASAKGNANSTGEEMEVATIVGKPPTPDQEDAATECKMLDRLNAVVLDPVVDKPQLDAVKKHLEMMEKPAEMAEPVNADDEVNRPRLPSTPRSAKFFPDCVGGWETGTNLDTDTFEVQPGRASDTTDSAVTTDASTYPTSSMVEDVPRAVLVNHCVEKNSLEYNMSHERRGRAVIFHHVNFVNAQERIGSNFDRDKLVMTLRQLDFDICDDDICEDFTYAQIEQKIKLLNEEDHSKADCLVVAILTHGKDGDHLKANDKLYSLGSLWTSFTADRCPSLAGKPKIFLVQACRGDLTDLGVGAVLTSGSKIQTDSSAVVYQMPSHADFLLAYSCVDGHYSYRNKEKGSWFIQSLCKELQASDTSKVDLQRILTRTARRVAIDHPTEDEMTETIIENGINVVRQMEEILKQVPTILSTLIREVYFPPKPKPSGGDTQQ